MRWQTHTEIPDWGIKINHQTPLLLLGSCFVENMGAKLHQSKFNLAQNPTGIVYNPLSLLRTVQLLAGKKLVQIEDLQHANGRYFSWDHHSRFSEKTTTATLQKMNAALAAARKILAQKPVVFITLGTAFYWQLLQTKQVVNNCHKMPANLFAQKLLDFEEAQNALHNVIEILAPFATTIVFTVSPVRHLKHGSAQNNLSKSTLILAAHHMASHFKNVYYFPAYELIMDDLRDYRFYTEDLLHPNAMATNYVWEKFGDCFFTEKTHAENKAIKKVQSLLQHKLFDAEMTPEILHKIETAAAKCSVDFNTEIADWKYQWR